MPGGADLGDLRDRVAVVTGGASGVGRGIAHALVEQGARVVIADVEEPALDRAVSELSASGDVTGVPTDVSDFDSMEALAKSIFDRFGACHLLFNNAGVTSGGGGLPWEQEPNDWKWCFGVNVFGVANGVLAFVPRMIASGEPGIVVNTSSGDGGIAPVFYPSGGLLDTGLWTASRNRPPELAREREHTEGPVVTFAQFRERLAAAGKNAEVVDLLELGRLVLRQIRQGRFVIGHDLDEAGALLHARADAIAEGRLPPHHDL
jgi:hypothetical protein